MERYFYVLLASCSSLAFAKDPRVLQGLCHSDALSFAGLEESLLKVAQVGGKLFNVPLLDEALCHVLLVQNLLFFPVKGKLVVEHTEKHNT